MYGSRLLLNIRSQSPLLAHYSLQMINFSQSHLVLQTSFTVHQFSLKMQKSLVFVGVVIALISSTLSDELTSSSVNEGPCHPDDNLRGAQNVSLLWALGSRSYYTSMGSESMFRGYFEVLRGRPAESEEELLSMKLKLELQSTKTFRATGFDQPGVYYVQQACALTFTNQFLCVPLYSISTSINLFGAAVNVTIPLSAPGTNTSGITTSRDTVMQTDNESYAVIVRCLNNTVQDWKLLTVSPIVSPEIKQIAESTATRLGFNSTNFRTISF